MVEAWSRGRITRCKPFNSTFIFISSLYFGRRLVIGCLFIYIKISFHVIMVYFATSILQSFMNHYFINSMANCSIFKSGLCKAERL